MSQVRSVAGTRDLFGEEQATMSAILRTAAELAAIRGYQAIETPIFEYTEVFARGVGQGTDVVEKEMYTFEDRGGRSLTLRPEATASVVRAYFEGGMSQVPQPVRLHYQGPMFRAERPQAGRYRQFAQHGVEAIGEGSPGLDAEVVELAAAGLAALGLEGVALQLNSLGDAVCRPAYRDALRDHYRPHLPQMCEDCQRRFEINPLRLLDCKKQTCQPYQAGAPSPVDHLCEACADHHATVKALLTDGGVTFHENPRLVRGLDYYTRTAFEFWHVDLQGAQNALGGGGRYDGLAEVLGFPDTPGVGFAMGVDRIYLALLRQGLARPQPTPEVVVLAAADGAAVVAARLASELRSGGMRTVVDHSGRSLKARMRQAQKMEVLAVVLIGEEEMAAGAVSVRDMNAGEQSTVPLKEAVILVAGVTARGRGK
ncbi:MAG: histidine--tRNA ligase [Candidatus Dormibacteria bacterium]